MLPVLFSIGSVTIYTLAFLLAIGFFLSAFIIWKRLIDLGLKEEKVIDMVVGSGLFGLLVARLLYIAQNFPMFGFFFDRWIFISRYPGLSFWGGLLGIFWGISRYCKKEKWDFWQIADEATFGILPLAVLSQIGCFFDGCVVGKPTNMPWGMFFPGSLLRQNPVSLFGAVSVLAIWLFLLHIERRWRMWDWYKSKANGFIFLTFFMLLLLFNLPLALLKETGVYFLDLEISLSLLGILTGSLVLYKRSGRNLKEKLAASINKKKNHEK